MSHATVSTQADSELVTLHTVELRRLRFALSLRGALQAASCAQEAGLRTRLLMRWMMNLKAAKSKVDSTEAELRELVRSLEKARDEAIERQLSPLTRENLDQRSKGLTLTLTLTYI